MGSDYFLARLVARLGRTRAAGAVHDLDFLVDDLMLGPGSPFLSFHVDLAQRLQHLQLQGSGSAHINWLLDALSLTVSTHSSLLSALTTPPSPSIPPSPPYTHLVNQRADQVVPLLDVCSSLLQVADDVQRQLGKLQHALQSVGQSLPQAASIDHHQNPLSSGRIRAAARRLSACFTDQYPHSLLSITSTQYRPLAEARAALLLAAKTALPSPPATSDPAAKDLSYAMDGATLTSLLLLASAVSSLAGPSPRKSGSGAAVADACKVITKCLGGKSTAAPWAAHLRQLQRDLRKEEMGADGGALFQELQSLHAAASSLHTAITNPANNVIELAVVRQRVDYLRKSSREAQDCMNTFRMHMAALFQALLALRVSLLDS